MHIIYRLCDSPGKDRPEWFSKEKCLRNFLEVFAPSGRHDCHFILDAVGAETSGMLARATQDHLDPVSTFKLLHINEHHNARACRRAFEYALELKLPNDTILYFVEDDYLHLPEADRVIEEGIEDLVYGYVTCYDHPDKYMKDSLNHLVKHGGERTRVECGRRTHWKATNSTTMTFAVRQWTLVRDWPVIQQYLDGDCPRDFAMFRAVAATGQIVGSPIPGYATHVEQKWLAPMVDWEAVAGGRTD